MKKILFIYGTRPEAIKMAPLIKAFQSLPKSFGVEVCLTGQHREMLDQINNFFGIDGDYDLALMKPNQSLSDFTSRCIAALDPVLAKASPDLIFVQGDTTTVLAGSLAAFYRKIPVAHLEAGLRSGDDYSPFPEEMNRKIAGQIASFHFAPTLNAAENLRNEGILRNVYVVGNTVIDALELGLRLIRERGDNEYASHFSYLDFSRKIILVTGHRRESFGQGFDNICNAIKNVASRFPEVQIVYPMHLNPNVREPVNRILSQLPNVYLIDPLEYPYLIWLMEKSSFVLTDSGGIQEEAPALGKPVLVMREVTERMEGIKSGTAKLVGTKQSMIESGMQELLSNELSYARMAHAVNPYGDGQASARIVEKLLNS